MAKETFSFEEAVAPAKVFSFEEALGEPAAANAPATEPEVVTSARPWQGAGAGRGGLNDPRRLDVARPNVTGSVLDGVNLGRPTVDYEANLDAMQKSASPGSVMFSPGRTKQAVDKQIELGELARRAGYESIPDYVRAQEDSERRQQFAEDNPNIGALASGLATVTKGTLNAIPAAAGFVNKTFVDPFLGIAGARMSDVPTAPGTSALDSMAKDFMPAVGKLKLADAWDGGVFKEWLAANVSAQVPQIAQSVYGVVNPAAVGAILPMMGAQAAGGSFAEGDDPRVAVSKGIVEMLSEGASFGVAEKVKTVLQGLPSAARQSVLRNVAQKALAVGGALTAQQLAGAVEESVAQLGGNALDIYASGKQKSMLDGVPEAAVIGAAVNTAMALPNVAEAARSNRPEDQAARELARELERGNLAPGAVETLNPNLSQPAITPKTLAGLTEIGAAASVDEAIIAAARATTPQAQAVDNIGRLLGDSANVSQPGNIPPVDSGAAGAGAPEPGIRVEAGMGASGAAGPALDAGGVRDQPAGGAAPLATGRGAELTPDIAETTRQIQELERAPESKPGQETRGEPASVWFGRRGDGYQTPEDAQSALPTRTRISPELDWRVEQMPTGRYRLAGYDTETRAPTFTVRMNPTGTATVLGNPKAIAAKLAEAGITKVLPNRDGVTVATSQAQAAAQFLGGGEDAARTDAASAAIKPVAPPANPPTQAQSGLSDEGAGATRPAPAAAPEQVGPYGRDLTPIAQGGKPFKTKAQADAFRKANTNNMRTVKQGKGFALRELTPKELAAREKAAKRLSQASTSPAGVPISAHAFIADKGGLSRAVMGNAGFDRNMKVGNRWLFAGADKPGLTLAEAAELLAEAGYIREESESAAADIIKRSITNPQYTAEGWERIAEAEQATRFEDHLAAQQEAATEEDPFGPAPAFTPAEVMVVPKSVREEYAALMAAAEEAGIDTESVLEEAARVGENWTQEQYNEYVRQALTNAIANSRREADRGESAVQGREDAERSGTESSSSNTGRPGDAPSQADEGLTARSGTQQAAAPQRSKTDGRKLEAGPAELAEAQSFRYKLPSLERLLTKENLDTNDGFHMHLLANAMETARAYNAIMVDSGGDPSGIEYRKPADPKYPNLPEKFAVVLPDASNAGKWRVSYFDPKGFSYHETADSAQDATVEMVSSGFTIKDVGALDRLAATREWALGTDYAALIDQYNRKMITSDEFTARQKALNDDYERDTNPLTAPTQQDVLAQQDRRDNADDLDQREQIQREASGFQLQAQAPEQRRDNTGDMFGGPSVEDVQRARKPGKQQEDDGTAPLFSRAQPFYSALSKSIEGMTPKALTGAMWKDGIKGLINKGAVKEDEVEWSGVREWLDLVGQTPAASANRNAPTAKDFSDAASGYAKLLADVPAGNPGFVKGDGSIKVPRDSASAIDPVLVQHVAVNPESLLDFRKLASGRVHELGEIGIPAQRLMVDAVRAATHDLKVLRSIVELIPVDVMNHLAGKQISAESLLGDKSVLERAFTVDRAQPIPRWVDMAISSLLRSPAFKVAEVLNAGLETGRRFGTGETAVSTEKRGHVDSSGQLLPNHSTSRKVSKEDVLAYLDANGVQVQEVVLGGSKPEQEDMLTADDIRVEPEGDQGRWFIEAPTGSVTARAGTEEEAIAFGVRYFNSQIAERNRNAARDADNTKYSQYTLPGGENYREVLLTLPEKKNAPIGGGKSAATMLFERDMMEKYAGETFPSVYRKLNGNEIDKYEMLVREDRNSAKSESMAQDRRNNYKSSHWDQKNIVAHIRLNDRTDADGNRVLFVEEIQSDWGQEGKKKGFGDKPSRKGVVVPDDIRRVNGEPFYAIEWEDGARSGGYASRESAERAMSERAMDGRKGIPLAPFVTSTDKWLSLALKRVITMAAQEGYDRVAFVNGEQSAERYDLSKQVDSIAYQHNPSDDTYKVQVMGKDGHGSVWYRPRATLEEISNTVGKEIADRIQRGEGEKTPRDPNYDALLKGLDLKVGGEGMRIFYDRILPNTLKDVLKKVGGGRVEMVNVGTGVNTDDTEIRWTEDSDGIQTVEWDGGERKFDTEDEARAFRDNLIAARSEQPGFTITPEMREKASAGLPLFRKGADQTTGLTPTQFTQALSEAFGAKVADRLQAKGVVVPLADQTKLPAHVVPYLRAGDVVFGFYDPRTDRTYAVLENLTPDMVKGLALHEVGVHYGFEAMLGADKYKQVMKQLRLMRRSGNVAVQAAYDQAQANAARPSQIPEETLAYLVQEAPNNSVIKDVIARIKAWLFREFGIGGKYLTERDLHMLARAAVQHAARTEPGGVEVPAFMRASDDPVAASAVAAERVAAFRSQYPATPPSGMSMDTARTWLRDRRAALDALVQELAPMADGMALPVKSGGTWLVSREARPDGSEWRITRFDKNMVPQGHEAHRTAADAVADLVASVDVSRLDGWSPEFSRTPQTETKDPDIRFSRTNAAQTEDTEPVRPELSPWRDATGRLQFAPGAWLAAKYGDTGKGAIAGAVTGAMTAGPVGAVVGAAVGAGIGAKLSQLQLKAPTPELRRIMRQMKLDVAKAQEVAAAVAGEATKLTEDERAMVSDLIEKELKAGTIPPEHAVRLAAMINSSMEQQTEELVRLGMLTKDSADRWRGQYLPRYYESKLTEKAGDLWADAMRSITRRPSAMKGIKGKHLRGRGLYETIPESQLEDYKTMGWEVRDPDYQPGVTTDGTVQVWRDFTRQERDKMGEIRDAGFRFVMGYMQTQKDIALGKMFEQLAIDPEMSSRLETEKFSVRVPDGKAPGTEVKTYGKLAGRYVTPETLSQLSLIEESQSEALMMYRKALGIWKEGKALALDTPIPTPSGWTTMGALQPGDQVFDEKGRPCEVTFATPVQMDRECFEVEFSDGCKIVADAEHLWLTKYHGVESVKTTKRILETLKYAGGQYNAHSVPVAGPLTLPDQTLPIDPYYLGVWLGNGTARNTAITSCQADGEVIMGFLRDRGLGIGAVRKDPRGDCITYSVGFDGYRPRRELLQPTMRALNLLQNKHIPAIYLRASEQQRLDLLCGLMDTDGTISERGQLEFCTTTEALKDGIVELARSLGFKPRARKQTAAGNNQVSWLVKFHGYDDRPVFALPRKIARLRKAPETRQRSSTRQIVAITPVASVPVKCIQVSSESRLYLAGEGMIPTHNTVLNPVSHVNNTISNMSMAHFAGVSYGRADKYLAAMRDFARKDSMILEAKDNGLFLGTLSEAELMNTLPEDLKALAQKQEGTAEKVGRTTFNLMTFYLRRPMGWAYQAEDTFFRYLIYKDARGRGMEPQDAVDYAQRYIFTYDDLPKTARRIRDFGIPFFAYTYKAVPALLHTALTHPERLAAPAAVLWTINAAAYAIAAGDDEDDWDVKLRRYLTDPEYREKARAKEKLERELLPEWNKGTTSLMTPKVIRLGNDELTKLPLFIDVSRIIPGGDLFDVNPNAGGIGLPQPFTPSHPLFTTAVAMLANKDLFFGKDLTDSNDTAGEKFDKRAAWMWKQLTPAITVNNYHFERGMNALAQAAGGEVKYVPDFLGGDATGIGRDGLPVQPKLAAMQTFGIKVRPYDLDAAESIQESAKQKLIRDIDTELRKLRRLENKGAVSDRTAEKERELANLKKDRLRDGKTVDGEDR